MSQGCQTLTEKEKQTLRLMGRGHDAKSMARLLDLSVYTVHERLRAARRKLSVSSSREAARLLLESEPETPYSFGDKLFGEAGATTAPAENAAAIDRRRTPGSRRIIAGVVTMSLALTIAAFVLQPQVAQTSAAATPASATQAEVVRTARDWLALVDAGRWEESWRGTADSFRAQNTVEAWTRASEQARVPLGALVSRTDLSQESIPAPPNGLEMVKFRTSFANRAGVTETLTLVREGQAWRVAGIYIE
jgi:DNA-binding CsgD family transcriptional regulator